MKLPDVEPPSCPKGLRFRLAAGLSPEAFFAALRKSGIHFCILPRNEAIPRFASGDEIDVLIADEDLSGMNGWLSEQGREGVCLNIFTVFGSANRDEGGLSFMPPVLARKVLADAVDGPDIAMRLPSPLHHLLVIVYRGLFHAGGVGELSHSPSGEPAVNATGQVHLSSITVCARRAGVEISDVSLSGLIAWVEQQGWLPSMDTLLKLAGKCVWIRDFFFPSPDHDEPSWRGLTTFIVRERGLPLLPFIRDCLTGEGFHLLREGPVPEACRADAKSDIRGGHWSRGPWPQNGGDPAYVLVGFDLFPVQPADHLNARHFGLTNVRALYAMLRVRQLMESKLPADQRCDILHYSANSRLALRYLQVAWGPGDYLITLPGMVSRLKRRLDTGYINRGELSRHSRRAALFLVDVDHRKAVCKIFRPGCERFMERELLARQIAGNNPHILPVIGHGDGYILFPYLDAIDTHKRFINASELSIIRSVIRVFREAGFELIDFKPGNILLDRKQGLKVIDFEFMQPGKVERHLAGCYCWYRAPDNAGLDLPAGTTSSRLNYHRFWVRHTGIPLCIALRELPSWVIVPVQAVYQVGFWLIDMLRFLRKKAGLMRDAVARRRLPRWTLYA